MPSPSPEINNEANENSNITLDEPPPVSLPKASSTNKNSLISPSPKILGKTQQASPKLLFKESSASPAADIKHNQEEKETVISGELLAGVGSIVIGLSILGYIWYHKSKGNKKGLQESDFDQNKKDSNT